MIDWTTSFKETSLQDFVQVLRVKVMNDFCMNKCVVRGVDFAGEL